MFGLNHLIKSLTMPYLLLSIFLLATELLYFRLANRFNIIDKPNERSLHSKVTIRGGGIIFWVAAMVYFVYSGWSYPFFFLGLTLVAAISFLDDIFTLTNRYRIFLQFAGVGLMLWQLELFQTSYWFVLPLLVVGVGILNAYNFMDGINGITGGYSTVVLLALLAVNNYHRHFIENDFLLFILIGLSVFNFFNFRTKALCFAGDVGSISIAFVVLFLILKVSILDNNPIYILFLSVYGVDSVLTIIQRLMLKQNIFKAHRLHLFQVIVHRKKVPHLGMSGIYMAVQSLICVLIINQLNAILSTQLLQGFFIILILCLIYYWLKKQFKS